MQRNDKSSEFYRYRVFPPPPPKKAINVKFITRSYFSLCPAPCDTNAFDDDILISNSSSGEYPQTVFMHAEWAYFSCEVPGYFAGIDSAYCHNGTFSLYSYPFCNGKELSPWDRSTKANICFWLYCMFWSTISYSNTFDYFMICLHLSCNIWKNRAYEPRSFKLFDMNYKVIQLDSLK